MWVARVRRLLTSNASANDILPRVAVGLLVGCVGIVLSGVFTTRRRKAGVKGGEKGDDGGEKADEGGDGGEKADGGGEPAVEPEPQLKDTNIMDIVEEEVTIPSMNDALIERFRKGVKLNEDELEALYTEALYEYHNVGAAIMEDAEFDALEARLKAANPKNKALAAVGAPVRDATRKVTLPYWMGSLEKIRDDSKAVDKWKGKYAGDVVVSDKLDGNSAMFVFNEKTGERALYSRGDGQVGQDCSGIVQYIKGVRNITKGCIVRGEVIMSRKAWDDVVKAKGGANARNVTAGIMNAKTPDADVARELEFVAYELMEPKGLVPAEGLKWMTDAGFIVVPHRLWKETELTMESLSTELVARRAKSKYEVDGIVVAHNEVHRNMKLKNPKYAFAFKSVVTHDEAEVTVVEVEWNVSKDGYMKPTVIFQPVSLNGVVIRRATGFNAAYIKANGIGVGARIVIIRSGDVIPKIVRVVTQAPGGPTMPKDGTWEWVAGTGAGAVEVDIRAVVGNNENDAAAAASALEYFAKTMEMDFVGRGTIDKLAANGVTTVRDLMSLNEKMLRDAPHSMGQKSAERIAASIKAVREKGVCEKWMVASNLFGRGIGNSRIKAIVEVYPEVTTGKVLAPADKTRKVEGVSQKTLDGFFEALPAFTKLMKDMGVVCVNKLGVAAPGAAVPAAAAVVPPVTGASLQGQVIVFTGFRDKVLEAAVEARGGQVASTITKKTTLIVAKDPSEASGKLQKAREMGIKIVGKDAFVV